MCGENKAANVAQECKGRIRIYTNAINSHSLLTGVLHSCLSSQDCSKNWEQLSRQRRLEIPQVLKSGAMLTATRRFFFREFFQNKLSLAILLPLLVLDTRGISALAGYCKITDHLLSLLSLQCLPEGACSGWGRAISRCDFFIKTL